MTLPPEILSALGESERAALEAWLDSFFPFQLEWVTDYRPLAALNKCRQIGGSHSFGAWATLGAVLCGEDCVLVSRAEQEAVDLLGVARGHAAALYEMGFSGARVTSPPNQTSFKLASGAEIRATTSKAAGRGFSGNVVLDEFAYHDRPEEVWDAALAATTHGYRCRILSTPNGVGNLFHKLCTELAEPNPKSPKKWRLYQTTIHEAIAQGMRIDIDECWERARQDPRVFAQLYEGSFLDADLQYIPHDMIMSVSTGLPLPGRTFAGIDIGESRDRTVLVVLQGTRDIYSVKHVESHARTDDALIQKLVDEAYSLHGCSRVAIDATGLGTFPVRAAQRAHPSLEAVWFTNAIKEELATRLYQSMASGKLSLPKPSPGKDVLHADISKIRRIVTAAGNVRFDASRTSEGHADSAWALMLALHATEYGEAAGAYSRLRGMMKRA